MANKSISILFIAILCFLFTQMCFSQLESITLGKGINDGVDVTTSHSTSSFGGETTLNQTGFLPNLNAASRFLSQATLGYNMEDIEYAAMVGKGDWIEDQIAKPIAFSFADQVADYHQYRKDAYGDPTTQAGIRFFDYAWWQYHMQSDDLLRQRVAFALSEIIVISRVSSFLNEPYAFASFYDILLNNSFGNFRDLIEDVTFHPAMGQYLTYINNPKTDTIAQTYPDENYAREIMQLFTIGLFELNNDGTMMTDTNGDPIPTYDNDDITEFSKIFTGLTWSDWPTFGRVNHPNDTSYVLQMTMWNDHHEPGVKKLLNGFIVPDRMPVDGVADIQDALDNLFNHQNVGPFIAKALIQRLVTSNPSPAYVNRVANAFNDNGNGVRGDLAAVARAILLDPIAIDCASAEDPTFGMLREPFVRYMHLNKAFDNSTDSGIHRNDMEYVFLRVNQKPNNSPSVFNFFQPDHQPIGPIEEGNYVAPEFQITNSVTISGWVNGVHRWIYQENPADEYVLYINEPTTAFEDQIAFHDYTDEILLADDDHLHMLLDRLNLLLTGGKLSSETENIIIEAVKQFNDETEEDLKDRAKIAIYLVLTTPGYLINR